MEASSEASDLMTTLVALLMIYTNHPLQPPGQGQTSAWLKWEVLYAASTQGKGQYEPARTRRIWLLRVLDQGVGI